MICRRRDFLKAIGIGAASYAVAGCTNFAAGSAGKAVAERPNVIFILIDDMGWKDLGCYGASFFETPNIDRLASEGMRFTNGYAACAVCTPTRASIMTGKYPARLHMDGHIRPDLKPYPTGSGKLINPQFKQWLEPSEETIAEALKTGGYISASIGKSTAGQAGRLPAGPPHRRSREIH